MLDMRCGRVIADEEGNRLAVFRLNRGDLSQGVERNKLVIWSAARRNVNKLLFLMAIAIA